MGSLYILIAIFLWSSLGIVVRLAGIPVHLIMFYSIAVSLIVQAAVLSSKKYRAHVPQRKHLKYAALLGVVSLLNTFTYFYAFQNTTIANAVLTHYTAPIIVALLAPVLLKEKISKKIIAAIVIGTTGLLVMLNGFSAEKTQTWGIISGLVSGFMYAMIIIILRCHSQKFHPLVLAFLSNAVIAALLAPFVREFPISALWSFLVIGLVHSTVALALYFKGTRSVTASKTAVLGYLEPMAAIMLSVIFLDEFLSLNTVIGGFMIIISGYITLKKKADNDLRLSADEKS